MRRAGLALLAAVALATAGASWLAPNPPERRFPDLISAPPTRVRVWDGVPRAPFIYRQRVVSRLERQFENVTTERVSLHWPYYAGLAVATGLFGWQQWLIRDRSRAHCFAAFRNNNWVGLSLWLGLMLALAIR